MKVRAAAFLEYETSTGPWKLRWVTNPHFNEIESGLRLLDGDLCPSIMLFFDSSPDEDGIPDFEVLGGHVGYFIQARKDAVTFHLHDSLAPTEMLPVWISDQGTEISAQKVCRNLEVVIEVTKIFCETAELCPELSWRAA